MELCPSRLSLKSEGDLDFTREGPTGSFRNYLTQRGFTVPSCPKNLRRLPACLILTLAVLTLGCGDSSDIHGDSGTLNGGNRLPAAPGRLAIGQAAAQARIAFLSPDGKTLATTTTVDPQGSFGTDVALPGSFIVEATPAPSASFQGSLGALSAELEGFQPQSKEIVVNVPTTLLARFHQRHPDLSLSQVRSRVHQFLAIPESTTLEALDDSPGAPFVHDLFFRLAQDNGGVEPFLEMLLDEMEGSGVRPISLKSEEGNTVTTFLGGCAFGLAEDFVKSEVVIGIGWAFRAMGINFPFPSNFDLERKLNQLSLQIDEVSDELTRFESQLDYQRAVDELGDKVVTPSDSSTQALKSAIQVHSVPLNPSLAYLPLNGSYTYLSELQAAFSQNDARSMLDLLVSYLEGTYSEAGAGDRMERLLVRLLSPSWGIDNDLSSYNGYGAFSNATISQQSAMLQYYLGYLEQTVLLFAEQTHNTSNAMTLVGNIRTAKPYLASLARAKKRILAQVPQPLGSDQLFVDRQAGLIWYMGNLGRYGSGLSFKDATTYASKFSGVGPLSSGWRLPVDRELDLLYRRIAAGNAAQASNQKPSSVMTRWGWDISYIGGNHRVWANDGRESRFSLDDGNLQSDIGGHNDVILVHEYSNGGRDDDFLPALSLGSPQAMTISGATPGDIQGPGSPMVQLRCLAQVEGTYGGNFTVGGQPRSATSGSGFSIDDFDLTENAVWTSSNELMATVSNFEGTQDSEGNVVTPPSHGLVVWQPQFTGGSLQPVTITATYRGASASITLRPPSSVTPVLSSIQVFPYNVDFGTILSQVTQPFAAVLFCKDPVTGDSQVQNFNEITAPVVTWTLTDSAGAPLSTDQNSGFFSNDPNKLILNTTLTTTFMVVQATVASSPGIVGTAPIKAGIIKTP